MAHAHVDLGAIAHNLRTLAARVAPAGVVAVVKADGYGHGAGRAAEAALSAGAAGLAVATPAEAVELARGGLDAGVSVLLLSEPDDGDLAASWDDLPSGIRFTVASPGGLAAIERLAAGAVPVHLEIDTGMHRMGVDPQEAVALARAVVASPSATLEGTWSHFAVADAVDDPFTAEQTRRFDETLVKLGADGIAPGLVHLCNSAGALAHPHAHRDLVRVGIALYGVAPDPALEGAADLRPALALHTPVTAVRTVDAGESVSYGRHWFADRPTRVATLGIGYADGVRRDCPSAGVEVLVRGRRRPMLGVVTMDQLMIAVDDEVAVGDDAVLIGSQGTDQITTNEIAARLGTIGYEVLTALGPRIARVYGGGS